MTEMKLNDIPMRLRSETACINRMKTAIKTGTLDQMHEVLEFIPKDILIAAYVRANSNEFRQATLSADTKTLAHTKSLADIPLHARTEAVCINAMRLAIKLDGLLSVNHTNHVLAFIPKEILITAFVRANLSEFMGDSAPHTPR
jgi:hypothetical protein